MAASTLTQKNIKINDSKNATILENFSVKFDAKPNNEAVGNSSHSKKVNDKKK